MADFFRSRVPSRDRKQARNFELAKLRKLQGKVGANFNLVIGKLGKMLVLDGGLFLLEGSSHS